MPARVLALSKKSHDVVMLRLQLPAGEPLQFHAGQYIEFILRDGTRRSYSMANAPHTLAEPGTGIELHIRHLPGGKFTDHVFGAMKEKEILRIEGPYGSFFLREDSDKPIVLLASGTGFAPIKALLEHMKFKGIERAATLYWGGRRPEDLYMDDWVRSQLALMPNLRYVPVVSNAVPEDNWRGRTGFVHRAVMEDFADLSGHQVYACGAPIVVDSAKRDYVAQRGLARGRVLCRCVHDGGGQGAALRNSGIAIAPLPLCPSTIESMNSRRFLLTLLSTAALLAATQTNAQQQRTIRLVVPYAAGGPIDVTARVLAERVKDSLGTVIIDNKPGAGGNIGADAVAKAAPDGLTIGIAATATNAVNPWLYSKMPFNAATDFAPITQMVRVPNVLVMNAETAQRLKIDTLPDLIAYAKANPAKLNYGSGGNGSAGHLAGELFKKEAGIFAVHIPYNGGNPAQLALLSGQVDFNFDNLATAAPNIRSGKLKAIAVTTAQRSSALPEVPTVAATLKGFSIDTWWGLVAPAGTPADVVAKLNQAFVAALQRTRDQDPLRDAVGRAGRQHAGAVRGLHEERTREVRESRQGHWRQSGLGGEMQMLLPLSATSS